MPGNFIGIFQLYARGFHCDFSIACQGFSLGYFNCMPGYFIVIFKIFPWLLSGSLRFFNCMPGYFIGIFQLYARGFHWDISIICLAISIGFFKCMPGYFIGIFQLYARGFHWDFSIACLAISLGYFNCMPGYFIVIFKMFPWLLSGSVSGSFAYILKWKSLCLTKK
jgi:accessory gene regulator protein AgrB